MKHVLAKTDTGWACEICGQSWRGKPRATCPGVTVYTAVVPKGLLTEEQLKSQNLKPKSNAVGCFKKSKGWAFLYDIAHTEVADPNLPPVYNWGNRPPELQTPNQLAKYNRLPGNKPRGCIWNWNDGEFMFLYNWQECPVEDVSLPPYIPFGSSPELRTKSQLKKENLAPGDASPRGFFRVWDNREKEWETVLLWHPENCNWEARDKFIAKTTLSKTYLLSKSWIKKLGEPDLVLDNPHHPRYATMQLYSRQRVERFLADRAEEYAKWLSDRDRYVAIFEINRDKIERGRERARSEKKKRLAQTKKCLRCASGCALPQGFLCAIHPMGLEEHQIPCPDFVERATH